MRTIPTNLLQNLQSEVQNIVLCWKITRTDGEAIGLTEYDAALSFDGVDYLPYGQRGDAAVESNVALTNDSTELDAILSDERITASDVLAGKYDGAAIECFLIDALSHEEEKAIIKQGTLGEITLKDGVFHAELRGLSQPLQQTIGQLYSPMCRTKFGDARCGITKASYSFSGTVAEVVASQHFTCADIEQDNGYFNYGLITFTSGNNDGISMEVKSYAGGTFILVLPLPFALSAGDSFTAVAGCDKRFSTCRNRFNNAVNFRGEPHLPGIDKMMETAGTRQG